MCFTCLFFRFYIFILIVFFSKKKEYNPCTSNIQIRTQELKYTSKIDYLKEASKRLKEIKFISVKDDPVAFINSFEDCFKNCEIDCSQLINFIPKNDLINFSDHILNNRNFKELRNEFINFYLPKYIELMKKDLDKLLDDFNYIHDYISFKYEFYAKK